ncbi:2'-5'-oligoadenylate synthase 1-like [Orbicella faveolata]|uniref:2'-5'-oligoadenylate synthase 1-like n=1 Tax=Orbicella faveolata TaxID=48498 RepID=UPI0009E4F32F|nr:2'-5'-oligoadenylate synthase 1-like [Orbicella faveolata]
MHVEPNPKQDIENLLILTFLQGGSVAEWLGRWICVVALVLIQPFVFFSRYTVLIVDKYPLSFQHIIQGGSVGKGTAVKDKADIDCVVFFNSLKTMEDHKVKLQETKNCLESCLKQSPTYKKDQITFDRKTRFAVKFKLCLDLSPEFDIDLLPTFTATDLESPEQRYKLYEEMIDCTTEDQDFYSAHLVSLQKEFVKDQPPIVKNLIRLVKYWRKTCIEDKSTGEPRLPSSYPLELITIDCWENAAGKTSFDIRAGFKAVLERLADNCHIHVIWHKYYDKDLAERGIKMCESPPFVLDPANPTNNVCSASDAEGWKTVADVAKMTLQRQPLKDINFNKNWEIIQI